MIPLPLVLSSVFALWMVYYGLSTTALAEPLTYGLSVVISIVATLRNIIAVDASRARRNARRIMSNIVSRQSIARRSVYQALGEPTSSDWLLPSPSAVLKASSYKYVEYASAASLSGDVHPRYFDDQNTLMCWSLSSFDVATKDSSHDIASFVNSCLYDGSLDFIHTTCTTTVEPTTSDISSQDVGSEVTPVIQHVSVAATRTGEQSGRQWHVTIWRAVVEKVILSRMQWTIVTTFAMLSFIYGSLSAGLTPYHSSGLHHAGDYASKSSNRGDLDTVPRSQDAGITQQAGAVQKTTSEPEKRLWVPTPRVKRRPHTSVSQGMVSNIPTMNMVPQTAVSKPPPPIQSASPFPTAKRTATSSSKRRPLDSSSPRQYRFLENDLGRYAAAMEPPAGFQLRRPFSSAIGTNQLDAGYRDVERFSSEDSCRQHLTPTSHSPVSPFTSISRGSSGDNAKAMPQSKVPSSDMLSSSRKTVRCDKWQAVTRVSVPAADQQRDNSEVCEESATQTIALGDTTAIVRECDPSLNSARRNMDVNPPLSSGLFASADASASEDESDDDSATVTASSPVRTPHVLADHFSFEEHISQEPFPVAGSSQAITLHESASDLSFVPSTSLTQTTDIHYAPQRDKLDLPPVHPSEIPREASHTGWSVCDENVPEVTEEVMSTLPIPSSTAESPACISNVSASPSGDITTSGNLLEGSLDSPSIDLTENSNSVPGDLAARALQSAFLPPTDWTPSPSDFPSSGPERLATEVSVADTPRVATEPSSISVDIPEPLVAIQPPLAASLGVMDNSASMIDTATEPVHNEHWALVPQTLDIADNTGTLHGCLDWRSPEGAVVSENLTGDIPMGIPFVPAHIPAPTQFDEPTSPTLFPEDADGDACMELVPDTEELATSNVEMPLDAPEMNTGGNGHVSNHDGTALGLSGTRLDGFTALDIDMDAPADMALVSHLPLVSYPMTAASSWQSDRALELTASPTVASEQSGPAPETPLVFFETPALSSVPQEYTRHDHQVAETPSFAEDIDELPPTDPAHVIPQVFTPNDFEATVGVPLEDVAACIRQCLPSGSQSAPTDEEFQVALSTFVARLSSMPQQPVEVTPLTAPTSQNNQPGSGIMEDADARQEGQQEVHHEPLPEVQAESTEETSQCSQTAEPSTTPQHEPSASSTGYPSTDLQPRDASDDGEWDAFDAELELENRAYGNIPGEEYVRATEDELREQLERLMLEKQVCSSACTATAYSDWEEAPHPTMHASTSSHPYVAASDSQYDHGDNSQVDDPSGDSYGSQSEDAQWEAGPSYNDTTYDVQENQQLYDDSDNRSNDESDDDVDAELGATLEGEERDDDTPEWPEDSQAAKTRSASHRRVGNRPGAARRAGGRTKQTSRWAGAAPDQPTFTGAESGTFEFDFAAPVTERNPFAGPRNPWNGVERSPSSSTSTGGTEGSAFAFSFSANAGRNPFAGRNPWNGFEK
ncbi:hypothetical protein CERSUDRAFT_125925 [Gelatoporia subvermispora B]|uniref:Uncharacterized protein n=1 Tax=Ceriporiopsis subvermispora (strain B) TaxID=914234 RepID=M2QNA2_CERS8|nr:hypothetical protein CERSUDRAFT_125925 [Gelatoporia subvermispora B]